MWGRGGRLSRPGLSAGLALVRRADGFRTAVAVHPRRDSCTRRSFRAALVCALLPSAFITQMIAQNRQRRPVPSGPSGGGGQALRAVITAEATKRHGRVHRHRLSEQLYSRFPRRIGPAVPAGGALQRDARGTRYAGEELSDRVVRWQRVGNRILLRNVSYSVVGRLERAGVSARADVELRARDPDVQCGGLQRQRRQQRGDRSDALMPRTCRAVSAARAARPPLDPARSLVGGPSRSRPMSRWRRLQSYECD